MSMDRRAKNVVWCVRDEHGRLYSECSSASIAVLMDMRDELQTLNKLLGCSNFTGIPQTLKKIQTNTKKKKRKQVKP